ncbi:hypothetical protein HSX11_02225 [Oxalobacteraceae bacterium]|nr:hypothetical protein [Oxalobacteraceae bacterium]
MFWTVIALSAATCYEAAAHAGTAGSDHAHELDSAIVWFAIAWHVALIVGSSVLVSVATMEAAEIEMGTDAGKDHVADEKFSRMMNTSIGMSLVTAVSFTFVHVWFN